MKVNVGKYNNLGSAVGEVLSINGDLISIFIYPEKHGDVSIGEVLLVNSESYFPILVIYKNIHRARREQGFTPLKAGYEKLKTIYPDVDRMYIYAISGLLIGYIDEKGYLNIGYGAPPRLHDLTYVLDSKSRAAIFLDRDEKPDFNVIRYLFSQGIDPLFFREFIMKNMDVIKSLGDKEFVFNSLFNSLLKSVPTHSLMRVLINDFIQLMGW